LIGALVFGGFCLYWAVRILIDKRETDEPGLFDVSEGKWAVLWIAIAVVLLAAGCALTIRQVRRLK
jgi:hypothetical protein